MDVGRVGDRDAQIAVRDRVGDGDDALQDVERNDLPCFRVDARERQVDERELVARGEHARDALARGDAFVDDRLRDGAALARAAADERELVGRDELRR